MYRRRSKRSYRSCHNSLYVFLFFFLDIFFSGSMETGIILVNSTCMQSTTKLTCGSSWTFNTIYVTIKLWEPHFHRISFKLKVNDPSILIPLFLFLFYSLLLFRSNICSVLYASSKKKKKNCSVDRFACCCSTLFQINIKCHWTATNFGFRCPWTI